MLELTEGVVPDDHLIQGKTQRGFQSSQGLLAAHYGRYDPSNP